MEIQVFSYHMNGQFMKTVAARSKTSPSETETRLVHLLKKIGVRSRIRFEYLGQSTQGAMNLFGAPFDGENDGHD